MISTGITHIDGKSGTAGKRAVRSLPGVPEDTPLFFLSVLEKAEAYSVPESMADHITQFSY
jgi:hypothetical protein